MRLKQPACRQRCCLDYDYGTAPADPARGTSVAAAERFSGTPQDVAAYISLQIACGARTARGNVGSAGALRDPLQPGLIATYSGGLWMHRGQPYSILSVTGGGCLLFGITRDPTIVSDPIEHFYFIGPTLSANGVAIAKYVEQQEMWHGLV